MAMVIAVVLGVTIGTFAAYFHGGYRDHIACGFIVINQAIPDFFLGLILMTSSSTSSAGLPRQPGSLVC